MVFQDLAGGVPTYIPKMNLCLFGRREKKPTSMYFKTYFNFFDDEIHEKFSCVFQPFVFPLVLYFSLGMLYFLI